MPERGPKKPMIPVERMMIENGIAKKMLINAVAARSCIVRCLARACQPARPPERRSAGRLLQAKEEGRDKGHIGKKRYRYSSAP